MESTAAVAVNANAAIRLLAVGLLHLVLACGPRANEQPPAASPEPSHHSVSEVRQPARHDVTVADRARWFELLRWPKSCEDDFAQTHLTEDGGMDFHPLSEGDSLLVVRCALGAYQPTNVVLLLNEDAPAPVGTVLEFSTLESLDGKTLAQVRTVELTGEIMVLPADHALTVLSLARQLGDCGTWARFELRDGAPVLTAFAERISCPETAGERANPAPGEPPAGWKSVPPI